MRKFKFLFASLLFVALVGTVFAATECEQVCQMVDVETCETIEHKGHWDWVKVGKKWQWVYTPSWSEEVCTTTPEEQCTEECTEVPDPVVDRTVKKSPVWRNVFHPDRRCHATKPEQVSWAYNKDNTLYWSATGGSKVELEFGWEKGNYPYKITLLNDGHEKTGIGTPIGYWFDNFRMRTVNDCRKGEWLEF